MEKQKKKQQPAYNFIPCSISLSLSLDPFFACLVLFIMHEYILFFSIHLQKRKKEGVLDVLIIWIWAKDYFSCDRINTGLKVIF
jgi:hypothetical protein